MSPLLKNPIIITIPTKMGIYFILKITQIPIFMGIIFLKWSQE